MKISAFKLVSLLFVSILVLFPALVMASLPTKGGPIVGMPWEPGNGQLNPLSPPPSPTPPPPTPPPPTVDPTAQICANQSIPAGWVVDQVLPATSVEPTCSGYEQYGIIELSSTDTMEAACGVNQTLPPDWVITQIQAGSPSGMCANFQPETIQNVLTSTVSNVCSMSPLPQDWVVDGVNPAPSSECAEYQSYNVEKVAGTQTGICSVSPIPMGWVVTQVSPFGGNCANYSPELIALASGSQMGLCATDAPIPDGWYISENYSINQNCGVYLNSIITKINSYDSQLFMCANSSPAPAGWTVSSVQPSNSCYPYEVEVLTHSLMSAVY